MFDRFSDRSKKALSLARLAALRLQHDYIDADHMLLGLLEASPGGAALVLAELGIDSDALRTQFEATLKCGDRAVTASQLPFTPAAKKVLERSIEEASALGDDHIGTEHLLLGLLREDSLAGAALREAGATLETVRRAITVCLDPTNEPTPDANAARRLLLISNSTMHGGGYLAHCAAEIRDFLAGKKTVAFVPYALADHAGYEAKAAPAFAAIGLALTSVHRQRMPRDALRDADAVFVGGGNTFRLLSMLSRTGLHEAIRHRVAAGLPYIGSSAGTNVATPTIKTTNDMPIVETPSFTALGLVPFQINPHYLDPDPGSKHMGETRQERLMQFHEENNTPVLGLREGCMLRVEGDTMTLLGTTNARLFRRGHEPEEFSPPCDLSTLLKTPYPRWG